MKKIFFGLLVMVSFFFISCEKETSEENSFTLASGQFRADIDGTQWVANILSSATRENGLIKLSGRSSDKKSITLIVGDSGVHSYSLNSTSTTNVGIYNDSLITPIASWSTDQWLAPGIYGDVNITAIDTIRKTMSGTFSMNVYRSLDDQNKTITNGVFNKIPYAVNVPSDTFRVDVDGSPFNYSTLMKSSTAGNFTITASQATGTNSVTLVFPNTYTPGDYPFDGLITSGLYVAGSSNIYISQSGTLTILENNPTTRRVRGNFAFTGTGLTPPDVNLSSGYFSIVY